MSVVLDDASNQRLTVDISDGNFIGDEASTMFIWFKADDMTLSPGLASLQRASDASLQVLQFRGGDAGSPVSSSIYLASPWDVNNTSTGATVSTWHSAAAVFASATDRRSFIDGGSKGTDTTSIDVIAPYTLLVGAYGAAGYFSGKLAGLAIWNKALSDANIASLHGGASPNSIEAGNLIGWWPLYDNGKAVVGSYDLSEVNSPTWDATDSPSAGSAPVPVDKTFSKKYVAAANNEVWYESSPGTMEELTDANGDIDTLSPLVIFEAFEKTFFVNGTNLKVADFGNTKIATASVGTHPPDFKTILTGGTSGAIMVVDYITALSSACTIYGKRTTSATFSTGETVTGTDDDGNAISFAMTAADEVAPPHWYDWTVYGNSTTYGAMPVQATTGCLWRGRIELSADSDYPHQWYQSRQRNPWDWNYVANDAQSPVAGHGADMGEVGDIVIATIKYNRDYLIHGCSTSLWVMAGDPAEGGNLYEFESNSGLLGQWSWCWDKEERLYLLTAAGILRIPKGFGPAENLTQLTYPDFIKDLAYDVSLHRVTMGYDRLNNGIQISRTLLSDGSNVCWWYDLNVGGLFPDTYPEECGMYSMFHYEAIDPDYRKLLFGCYDGYIRFADPTAKSDDIGATDETIDSYITFGPLKLGDEGREGILNSLLGIPVGGLASGSEADSNDLAYKIWTGQTADILTEKVIANTGPIITGTITASQNIRGKKKSKKARGMWAGIRVGNSTAAQTWGLERLLVNIKKSGRL